MKKFVCFFVSLILLLIGCAQTSISSQIEFSELSSSAISDNVKSNSEYKYKIVDNSVTIVEYIGKAKDVVVPDTIDGNPVKVIGEYAFYDCTDIETLKLPDSVEAIKKVLSKAPFSVNLYFHQK